MVIVIAILSLAAAALARGATLIAVAPGALLLVASTSALSPKGPVAIEVRPDGITLVEEDGTTGVVPRERIGSITVARWTSRLVIADRTGQVIVSRLATFYNWMPIRDALLAAAYPWRDPVLTYGS